MSASASATRVSASDIPIAGTADIAAVTVMDMSAHMRLSITALDTTSRRITARRTTPRIRRFTSAIVRIDMAQATITADTATTTAIEALTTIAAATIIDGRD